ncbi:MAG: ATP-binding protein, partial [Prochloraceae cyanobacterium]
SDFQEELVKSNSIYKELPIYYANSACSKFARVKYESKTGVKLILSEIDNDRNRLLSSIYKYPQKAIFIIDDWLTNDLSTVERRKKESQLQNILNLKIDSKLLFFLVQDYYLSNKVSTMIPSLKYSLPTASVINQQKAVKKISSKLGKNDSLALLGLSRRQIKLAIDLWENTDEPFYQFIHSFKVQQYRDLGLEFIATPDVETAGGLNLLQQYFQTIASLNEEIAADYKLAPPKGMLLLGVPGTGKTLCAKFAAFSLGYSLMAFSWSNILGAENSDRALSNILEIADTIDRVVLLADDFDKGFTGWKEGGKSMRLSQKLLTWMQEHTSRVLMIATVNRIGLLPAELKRRFDDGGIWFLDLPSMGEMQQVFKIYLGQYFPAQFGNNSNPWSDRLWYKLLMEYRGSTPVEIKNAVIRCATEKYCNLSTQEKLDRVSLSVTVEDLLAQLKQFVKSIDRDGEDLQSIRNDAHNFKPASSADETIFALKKETMFEYNPHILEH